MRYIMNIYELPKKRDCSVLKVPNTVNAKTCEIRLPVKLKPTFPSSGHARVIYVAMMAMSRHKKRGKVVLKIMLYYVIGLSE